MSSIINDFCIGCGADGAACRSFVLTNKGVLCSLCYQESEKQPSVLVPLTQHLVRVKQEIELWVVNMKAYGATEQEIRDLKNKAQNLALRSNKTLKQALDTVTVRYKTAKENT